jgi:hypothetical protein
LVQYGEKRTQRKSEEEIYLFARDERSGRFLFNAKALQRNRCRSDPLVCCSLAPTVGMTWPRQSGISGPGSTAPAEVRGGASFCSTAADGSSAGALSGSTVTADAGDILFGSAAAAAGCTSFSSTVGGLSGSTVASGAADTLFGSTAEAAGCASFSSTAGALPGSTEEAGAGDILFGSAAAAAGCASFGSTAGALFCSSAAAGSSVGVFVSCAGRGRGSGGDDTIRWRCAPVPVTWWNQVITLCATLETGGRALGGVGGCGPCAWADVAANNWRDRERCGPQHSRPHGRPSRSTQQ